jgi:hypothetical protein
MGAAPFEMELLAQLIARVEFASLRYQPGSCVRFSTKNR